MSSGSVSRQNRMLIYKRSYKLGRSTSVQVQARLTVNEDGSTAAYSTTQVSVTGKSASKTSGKGILEKFDSIMGTANVDFREIGKHSRAAF